MESLVVLVSYYRKPETADERRTRNCRFTAEDVEEQRNAEDDGKAKQAKLKSKQFWFPLRSSASLRPLR
jgi:hypothetical protein